MALISPDGNYVRVENIRLGKNLIQFAVNEYTDTSLPPVSVNTLIAEYSLSGSNPYVQAYEFLLANGYSDHKSDTEGTFITSNELPVEKKTRQRKTK